MHSLESDVRWFEQEFNDLRLALKLRNTAGEYKAVKNGKVQTLDLYRVDVVPSTKWGGEFAVQLSISPFIRASRLSSSLENICKVYGVKEPEIYRIGNDVFIERRTIETMIHGERAQKKSDDAFALATGYGSFYGTFHTAKEDFFAQLEGRERELHAERLARHAKRLQLGLGLGRNI